MQNSIAKPSIPMNILKYFGYALLILFTLPSAGYFLVSEDLSGVIAEYALEDEYQGTASVGQVVLAPTAGLAGVRDLKFQDPDGKEILAVSSMAIDAGALANLVDGKVKSFRVDGLRVTITQNSDGTWNWDSLKKIKPPRPQKAKEPFEIQNIMITNVYAEILTPDADIVVGPISVTGSLRDNGDDTFDGSLTLGIDKVGLNLKAGDAATLAALLGGSNQEIGGLKLAVKVARDAVSVDSFSLQVGNKSLVANGKVNTNSGFGDLALKVSSPDATLVDLHLSRNEQGPALTLETQPMVIPSLPVPGGPTPEMPLGRISIALQPGGVSVSIKDQTVPIAGTNLEPGATAQLNLKMDAQWKGTLEGIMSSLQPGADPGVTLAAAVDSLSFDMSGVVDYARAKVVDPETNSVAPWVIEGLAFKGMKLSFTREALMLDGEISLDKASGGLDTISGVGMTASAKINLPQGTDLMAVAGLLAAPEKASQWLVEPGRLEAHAKVSISSVAPAGKPAVKKVGFSVDAASSKDKPGLDVRVSSRVPDVILKALGAQNLGFNVDSGRPAETAGPDQGLTSSLSAAALGFDATWFVGPEMVASFLAPNGPDPKILLNALSRFETSNQMKILSGEALVTDTEKNSKPDWNFKSFNVKIMKFSFDGKALSANVDIDLGQFATPGEKLDDVTLSLLGRIILPDGTGLGDVLAALESGQIPAWLFEPGHIELQHKLAIGKTQIDVNTLGEGVSLDITAGSNPKDGIDLRVALTPRPFGSVIITGTAAMAGGKPPVSLGLRIEIPSFDLTGLLVSAGAPPFVAKTVGGLLMGTMQFAIEDPSVPLMAVTQLDMKLYKVNETMEYSIPSAPQVWDLTMIAGPEKLLMGDSRTVDLGPGKLVITKSPAMPAPMPVLVQ